MRGFNSTVELKQLASRQKKILDKKAPKEQMCFILISMINSLGLSDADFKNFHQKHNPNYMHDEEEDFDDFDDEEDEDYGDEDEF